MEINYSFFKLLKRELNLNSFMLI